MVFYKTALKTPEKGLLQTDKFTELRVEYSLYFLKFVLSRASKATFSFL